mmetsp:Transcript_22863/g.51528  ORF Transcript_22863/g.51528 Transcript_22863/m.51528 type:complete len:291 (-) Transcript_22863:167-1039(-)
MPLQRNIDYNELSQYFRLPEKVVAKQLGICLTSLKKVCRSHGIDRWPYRKMKSLDRKAQRNVCESVSTPLSLECKSPSEMSMASTAVSPSNSPEPETTFQIRGFPQIDVEKIGQESKDNVKISLSLSPQMLEQIGSGKHIRFTLQCDQFDSVSTDTSIESSRTTKPSSAADALTSHSSPKVGDVDSEGKAMSDEEIIAMLAGCAGANEDESTFHEHADGNGETQYTEQLPTAQGGFETGRSLPSSGENNFFDGYHTEGNEDEGCFHSLAFDPCDMDEEDHGFMGEVFLDS